MRMSGLVGIRFTGSPRRLGAHGCTMFLALCVNSFAHGQGAAQIYSCVDPSGKRLTSDRPIAACSAREQRVLNVDGSVKRMVPPTLTVDERSEFEARERDAAAERARRHEAIRQDRNLVTRFPNESAHRKSREAALDDMRKSMHRLESRLAALASERKPLKDEAEFYVGKPLPAKLKAQFEANDVSAEAQRALMLNQQLEMARIEKLYDAELERLKRLWAGEPPGSLGMLANAAASSPPRK